MSTSPRVGGTSIVFLENNSLSVFVVVLRIF